METLTTIPRNAVLQGHVLDRLRELPSDSVDVVVTSTPYYGLRDYGPECVSVWGNAVCSHDWQPYFFSLHNGRGDAQKSGKFSEQENIPDLKLSNYTCQKCGAWKGQLGLEPHPQMFIEHLAQVFLETKRVLKPSGSLWLNLGDTYFGGQGQAGRPENWGDLEKPKLSAHAPAEFILQRNKLRSNWLQPKQKMLIPARVAIALQDQGWILRNEIVWHKLNHMPESVTSRFTRSYESIYFFVKSPDYYSNLDAVREESHTVPWTVKPSPKTVKGNDPRKNYAGKFNELNAETMGSPRARVVTREAVNFYNPKGKNPGDVWSLTNEGISEEHFAAYPQKLVKRILSFACPKSGLVLDPFAGSGTSLLVAHKMGYDWLGIELVPKYIEIINKRIERHGKIRLDGFLEAPHVLACKTLEVEK